MAKEKFSIEEKQAIVKYHLEKKLKEWQKEREELENRLKGLVIIV